MACATLQEAVTFSRGSSATILPKSAISSASIYLRLLCLSINFLSFGSFLVIFVKFVSLRRVSKSSISSGAMKNIASVLVDIRFDARDFAASLRCLSFSQYCLVLSESRFVKFLVRIPRGVFKSCNLSRMARFQHCELTRARDVPPMMALLGLPTSSRLRQLTGKDCRMWNSTIGNLFII